MLSVPAPVIKTVQAELFNFAGGKTKKDNKKIGFASTPCGRGS